MRILGQYRHIIMYDDYTRRCYKIAICKFQLIIKERRKLLEKKQEIKSAQNSNNTNERNNKWQQKKISIKGIIKSELKRRSTGKLND